MNLALLTAALDYLLVKHHLKDGLSLSPRLPQRTCRSGHAPPGGTRLPAASHEGTLPLRHRGHSRGITLPARGYTSVTPSQAGSAAERTRSPRRHPAPRHETRWHRESPHRGLQQQWSPPPPRQQQQGPSPSPPGGLLPRRRPTPDQSLEQTASPKWHPVYRREPWRHRAPPWRFSPLRRSLPPKQPRQAPPSPLGGPIPRKLFAHYQPREQPFPTQRFPPLRGRGMLHQRGSLAPEARPAPPIEPRQRVHSPTLRPSATRWGGRTTQPQMLSPTTNHWAGHQSPMPRVPP